MIRYAQTEDCINLAVLSIQVWLETYAVEGIRTEYSKYVIETFTETYFLSLLEKPNYRLLVSEKEGILKGFILINLDSQFESEINGFEIEKLYVHRNFKGQGLGRQFLSEVGQRFGNSFWLYTWVENESNKFYKHLGFKYAGQLSFEFSNTLVNNNVYTFNCA
ncbi:N-acetyltransferase family protein [Reinekea sp.]|uniref:GNAT family N-acetyltransferase n=1 Tax=Reinekea sp. TaxID=1970455 RepID=UPI00398A3223